MTKFYYAICIAAASVLMSSCGSTSLVSPSASLSQEVVYEGTAVDGSYIVRVTRNGSDVNAAVANAKKAAVEKVLFEGLAANVGTFSQKPMIQDPSVRETFKAYFDAFFANNGPYLKFTAIPAGQTPFPVRSGSGYKVKTVLVVYKDALRKELENNKIIRKLTDSFKN